MRGRYEGGFRLRETEVAGAMGISRIPLREAFHQLAGEGLLDIRPNRGVYVVGTSEAELVEIAELCRLIEPSLLLRAVPELTPERLDQAASEIDAMDRIADPSEWFQVNWRFHLLLYGGADRPLQIELLRGLWLRADRYVTLLAGAPGRRQALNEDHRGILEACRSGDAARSVRLLKQHLDRGKRAVTRILAPESPRSAAPLG